MRGSGGGWRTRRGVLKALAVLFEVALALLRHLDVVEHALELLGEDVSGASLELADEGALSILVELLAEQTLGEGTTEGGVEHVLVVKVGEDANNLLELLFESILDGD